MNRRVMMQGSAKVTPRGFSVVKYCQATSVPHYIKLNVSTVV
jgi:hypothetical protein